VFLPEKNPPRTPFPTKLVETECPICTKSAQMGNYGLLCAGRKCAGLPRRWLMGFSITGTADHRIPLTHS